MMKRNDLKKTLKVMTLPIVASIWLVGCSSKSTLIASVNGEEITEEELNETLTAQYGSEVLDSLITDKIIELEAKELGVSVSEEELQAEYEEYASQYGGEETLLEMLDSYGMDVEDIKKDMETYLLTFKVMEDDLGITDDEIQTFFEENKETYGQAAEVEASHILVEDETIAQEVIGKLNAGEDFAELAKEYSTDTATNEDGGNLGYFGTGEMAEAFETAAFAMEVGDISSEPVETEYGFHVIKVTDKVEEKEAVYEEVKDTVYQDLLESKANEQYATWLTEKMGEYDIVNKLTE
ncbi:peptidylprolyl isomerase [Ureibacillus sp. 179-F W5.1 NHS]|uniref:Foldase protein PrsA n=1 Tax=Lysinibacillus halotolerans TaxID=1368476 RepID=A0A3M8HAX2_9BACI|nr:peptidylprolyl isomerase [Lysinibacillus halotolerans]RNC99404.1 foldase [Lysinibacillus halotolerans]